MDDTSSDLDAVRALLPDEQLRVVDRIKTGDRTTVRRVEATAHDGGLRSLVVKQYHTGDEGWLRETAALESVPGAVRVPAVVALGADPAVLVMEDLGAGPSLAQDLLGDDPSVAADAVVGWAEALAELHGATRDSREAFVAALARRAGEATVQESWMPSRLHDAQRVLDRVCGALGVRIPSGALDELVGLTERLGGARTAALTPADACPENNVRIGTRRVLIDFEGAQWRHLAWDVAYLFVPWPTCPNGWLLPDDVALRAVERYRAVAVAAFPEIDDPTFDHDVEAAVVGWSMITTAWALDHALDAAAEPERSDAEHPPPTRRAVILHRLGRAARSPELPALGELAGGLHEVLAAHWSEVPLELAPAFRGAGR